MAVVVRSKTERIRELNDVLRRRFTGGRVMLTSGVNELSDDAKARVLEAVRTFKDFDGGNDPHTEHDFGMVEVDGERYFFKIDYYDRDMRFGSDDPSDPEQTCRVMTIMRASEY
jgi:Protein of unknown function (DUF3768)